MLKRKYGLITITMMAISATLGSSILIAFGQVAYQAQSNPILMLLAWALGAILIIPGILLLAETASSYPQNGIAYNWLKQAKLKALAFWFGWILVLVVAATAIASAAVACGNVVADLFGISNHWYAKLISLGLLCFVAIVHITTKKIVIWSQTIMTVLKFLPIILLLGIGIVYGTLTPIQNSTRNLTQLYLASYYLLPAIAMTMFAYSGIEAISYIAGEIKEPRRNIIRAKVYALIVVVLVYLLLAFAIILINVANNWNPLSANLWNDIIKDNHQIPSVFMWIISSLAVIIFFGSLNAFLLYQTRIVHKLACEGDLFSVFAKTRKNNDAPYNAIIILVLLSSVYILWDQLYGIVTYFIIATSILGFIAFIVSFYLRYFDKNYQRLFNNFWYLVLLAATLISNLLCLIGAILAMYVFARNSNDWWVLWKCFIICGILAAGFPFYYLKILVNKRANYRKLKHQKTDELVVKN